VLLGLSASHTGKNVERFVDLAEKFAKEMRAKN